MLIEFSFENFKSFKSSTVFSLVAARGLKSRNRDLDESNLITVSTELDLLKSAVIYSPNAGGKSNLIKAANFMRNFVRTSFREESRSEQNTIQPFLLSKETLEKPSTFEMIFLIDGKQYRYGFSIDSQKIHSEWLYTVPKTKEIPLFIREEHVVNPNASNQLAKEFRAVLSMLLKINKSEPIRSNSLFLSVASQNNGAISQQITKWFSSMRFMSGLEDVSYRGYTINRFKDTDQRTKIMNFMNTFDVGIESMEIVPKNKEAELQKLPIEFREIFEKLPNRESFSIRSYHPVLDENRKPYQSIAFDLENDESDGTQKLFYMAGPIIDALDHGRILWVDEMEARFHTNLTSSLVDLFNSKQTNPNNAQLIFTTHDTNLLNLQKFRRDQIWFINKDLEYSSRLYSLADFKIRNDKASLEDDYLRGVYGATPHISYIPSILDREAE